MNKSPFLTIAATVLYLGVLSSNARSASDLGTLEATFSFHANNLATDPIRPYVYATTSSSLQIINTNTLTVEKSLPLTNGGWGMSFSPDASRLYVAGGSSNSIYVIDLAQDSLAGSVSAGDYARSVKVGLNNRLFVLTGTQQTPSFVKQIDATTGASTGPNLAGCCYPAYPPFDVYSGEIQISPDRTKLYYANYGLSPASLYEFDVSGTNPIERWAGLGGYSGEQLVLSPDGSLLAYVTETGLNGKTPNFSTLFPGLGIKGYLPTEFKPNALAYSPDGKLAYVLQWPAANISVFDTTSSAKLAQFTTIDGGYDMVADRTGQHLFVSYNGFVTKNIVVYSTGIPEPGVVTYIATALLVASATGFRKKAYVYG